MQPRLANGVPASANNIDLQQNIQAMPADHPQPSPRQIKAAQKKLEELKKVTQAAEKRAQDTKKIATEAQQAATEARSRADDEAKKIAAPGAEQKSPKQKKLEREAQAKLEKAAKEAAAEANRAKEKSTRAEDEWKLAGLQEYIEPHRALLEKLKKQQPLTPQESLQAPDLVKAYNEKVDLKEKLKRYHAWQTPEKHKVVMASATVEAGDAATPMRRPVADPASTPSLQPSAASTTDTPIAVPVDVDDDMELDDDAHRDPVRRRLHMLDPVNTEADLLQKKAADVVAEANTRVAAAQKAAQTVAAELVRQREWNNLANQELKKLNPVKELQDKIHVFAAAAGLNPHPPADLKAAQEGGAQQFIDELHRLAAALKADMTIGQAQAMAPIHFDRPIQKACETAKTIQAATIEMLQRLEGWVSQKQQGQPVDLQIPNQIFADYQKQYRISGWEKFGKQLGAVLAAGIMFVAAMLSYPVGVFMGHLVGEAYRLPLQGVRARTIIDGGLAKSKAALFGQIGAAQPPQPAATAVAAPKPKG